MSQIEFAYMGVVYTKPTKNFVNDGSAATAIEYSLIAALIAVATIAGATPLGESIDDKFQDVSTALDAVSETAGTAAAAGD